MTPPDVIIALLSAVDQEMLDVPQHPDATLYPSEVVTLALLFKLAPARRQPEPSWLIFGSGIAALLWLTFTAALAVVVGASKDFGATYGPLAGTIAVLIWSFLSAFALMLGLAFAAQLEAVRAGVASPRL